MVARYFNEDHIEYDEMELDTLSFLEPPLINNIGSISYQGQTNPSQGNKLFHTILRYQICLLLEHQLH